VITDYLKRRVCFFLLLSSLCIFPFEDNYTRETRGKKVEGGGQWNGSVRAQLDVVKVDLQVWRILSRVTGRNFVAVDQPDTDVLA